MSNRRHFMSLMGGAVAGAAAPAFADPQDPDLIVHNARVHTVNDALPKAQAFAVRAGRFVAVGGDDIKSLAGKKTRVFLPARLLISLPPTATKRPARTARACAFGSASLTV